MGNVKGAKLNWKRVEKRLECIGMSQRSLAAAIGVKPQAISAYKNGSRGVKAENLKKIADVLKVAPTYIIVGDGAAPEDIARAESSMIGDVAKDVSNSPVFQLLQAAGYEIAGIYLNGGTIRETVSEKLQREAAQIAEVSRIMDEYNPGSPAWVDFADQLYKIRMPDGREITITEENFQEISAMVVDLAVVAMRNLSRPVAPPPEEWRLPDPE